MWRLREKKLLHFQAYTPNYIQNIPESHGIFLGINYTKIFGVTTKIKRQNAIDFRNLTFRHTYFPGVSYL